MSWRRLFNVNVYLLKIYDWKNMKKKLQIILLIFSHKVNSSHNETSFNKQVPWNLTCSSCAVSLNLLIQKIKYHNIILHPENYSNLNGSSFPSFEWVISLRATKTLPILWFIVFPGASLTVPTSSSFYVEGTVDFVLFCAIDGGKVFCSWHRHLV